MMKGWRLEVSDVKKNSPVGYILWSVKCETEWIISYMKNEWRLEMSDIKKYSILGVHLAIFVQGREVWLFLARYIYTCIYVYIMYLYIYCIYVYIMYLYIYIQNGMLLHAPDGVLDDVFMVRGLEVWLLLARDVHVCVYIYIYMCIHVCIYVSIYKCTHTSRCASWRPFGTQPRSATPFGTPK